MLQFIVSSVKISILFICEATLFTGSDVCGSVVVELHVAVLYFATCGALVRAVRYRRISY